MSPREKNTHNNKKQYLHMLIFLPYFIPKYSLTWQPICYLTSPSKKKQKSGKKVKI